MEVERVHREASAARRAVDAPEQGERDAIRRKESSQPRVAWGVEPGIFFRAEARPDGLYDVALTDDGVRTFETALGIATDLGSQRRISTSSTIADIMDRTATRDELADVLRSEDSDRVRNLRVIVLRRKLRGSEEPSMTAKIIGHLGKLIIVGLVLIWSVGQIAQAIADIGAIPGILANIPHDILNLNPTAAITDTGQKIADAATHALYAGFGLCITFLLGIVIKPLRKIYRNDQIIPAERPLVAVVAALLRRWAHRTQRARAAQVGGTPVRR